MQNRFEKNIKSVANSVRLYDFLNNLLPALAGQGDSHFLGDFAAIVDITTRRQLILSDCHLCLLNGEQVQCIKGAVIKIYARVARTFKTILYSHELYSIWNRA